MKASMERLLMRCLHLILSIPVIALVYDPMQDISPLRWFFAILILVTGIWVWNGTLISKWLRIGSEMESI